MFMPKKFPGNVDKKLLKNGASQREVTGDERGLLLFALMY